MLHIGSININLSAYYYSKGRESFKLPEETYDGWALLTCEEGVFHYQIGEQTGEVRVGEAVLCPPGKALHRKALTMLSFHFAVFQMHVAGSEGAVQFPFEGKLTFYNYSRLASTLPK